MRQRGAERRYKHGYLDYTVGWILLTFVGIFGIHRFYMGKWLSGALYLLSGGVFLIGIVVVTGASVGWRRAATATAAPGFAASRCSAEFWGIEGGGVKRGRPKKGGRSGRGPASGSSAICI